jgi:hypothetical protein
VQQDEGGFRMEPQIAAKLKAADAFGAVDEQAESHQQCPNRQLSVRKRGSAGRRELPVARVGAWNRLGLAAGASRAI